jgi:hypothetical protein
VWGARAQRAELDYTPVRPSRSAREWFLSNIACVIGADLYIVADKACSGA